MGESEQNYSAVDGLVRRVSRMTPDGRWVWAWQSDWQFDSAATEGRSIVENEFDAVAEAVKIALALSRAAYVGVICDDAQVSLELSDGGEPEHQGEPFEDD